MKTVIKFSLLFLVVYTFETPEDMNTKIITAIVIIAVIVVILAALSVRYVMTSSEVENNSLRKYLFFFVKKCRI